MTKLLHIGLAKCGSTFLQQQILNEVAKKLKINYIKIYNNEFVKIDRNKIKFHAFENYKNLEKLLPKNFIISSESLFSRRWEFSQTTKSFRYIKKNFSKNTVILIVIRQPYELLNSIYCHSIQEMNIIKPEKFFYLKKFDRQIRKKNKFNLYNFDYEKLIALYKSYFTKVIVVKHEDLKSLKFLKKIFKLNNKFIKRIKDKKIIYNRSMSKLSINSLLFLNDYVNIKKSQDFLKKLRNEPKTNIDKIKNKLLSQFLLRSIFQGKIDKILPYTKYKIDKKYIPINIDYEISKYKSLKY